MVRHVSSRRVMVRHVRIRCVRVLHVMVRDVREMHIWADMAGQGIIGQGTQGK
jgi:hypothetical protein